MSLYNIPIKIFLPTKKQNKKQNVLGIVTCNAPSTTTLNTGYIASCPVCTENAILSTSDKNKPGLNLENKT